MARGPLKPKMPKPRTHPTHMKSKVRTSMIIIYQHYFTWWFSRDVRVSRPPHFWFRLGLGLTVIGLGLGLGLM